MCVNNVTRVLVSIPCSEVGLNQVVLAEGDSVHPHLPEGDKVCGVPMCAIHSNDYYTLRGHTVCCVKDCQKLGSLGPAGAFYCPIHLAAAVTPPPPVTQVTFAGTGQKAPARDGFAGFPDAVVGAMIKGIDPTGAMGRADVVDELTRQFGGPVLGNAVRVREVLGASPPADYIQFDPRLSDTGDFGDFPRTSPTPYTGASKSQPPVIAQGWAVPLPSSVDPRTGGRRRAFEFPSDDGSADLDEPGPAGHTPRRQPDRMNVAPPSAGA